MDVICESMRPIRENHIQHKIYMIKNIARRLVICDNVKLISRNFYYDCDCCMLRTNDETRYYIDLGDTSLNICYKCKYNIGIAKDDLIRDLVIHKLLIAELPIIADIRREIYGLFFALLR
jgi:hypothetical protein